MNQDITKHGKRHLAGTSYMQRYLLIYLAALIVVFFAAGMVNVIVDPKGYLYVGTWPGINMHRFFADGGRLEKSLRLRDDSPSVLILGTSRAQVAIDPGHPIFKGQNVYNGGLFGTNMYEIRRVMDFTLEHQNLERVVWGLDFLTFSDRRSTGADYDESLLSGNRWGWMFQYFFKPSTFLLSLKTIYLNNTDHHEPYSSRSGFLDKSSVVVDQRTRFTEILRNNHLVNNGVYGAYRYSQNRLKLFREGVKALIDNGVRVDLFISPVHARQLEAIRALGLWPVYEKWKQDLTETIEEIKLQAGAPLNLWDFGYYNSITTENIPVEESGDQMRWYWESSHYRKETGNLVLNRMNGATDPSDFGIEVDTSNITEELANHRAARDAYALEFPQEVQDVEYLVEVTRPEREKKRAAAERGGLRKRLQRWFERWTG